MQCTDCTWSSPDGVGRTKAGIYELLHGRHFSGDSIVLQNIHSIKVVTSPPPQGPLSACLLFPGVPGEGCTEKHPKQQDASNDHFKDIDWHFEKEFD